MPAIAKGLLMYLKSSARTILIMVYELILEPKHQILHREEAKHVEASRMACHRSTREISCGECGLDPFSLKI